MVGAGQSGLETAALLLEAGAASVKVLVRGPRVHWLRYGSASRLHAALHSRFNPARHILYPASDIGPPGINFLVDQPTLFRLLPSSLQGRVARRAIRPAGAGWLPERLGKVTITTNVAVRQLRPTGSRLRLELSDGTSPEVDHLFLATGYRVDIARYAFLEPLIPEIRRDNGYPQLTPRFQTSVPGLYIVGAPAAKAFGPLQRFVAGTRYTAERAVPDFT